MPTSDDGRGKFVEGFHGTSLGFAVEILKDQKFRSSENDYDWLGAGVYFFEDSYDYARVWAERRYGGSQVAVLRARIYLGECLDLTIAGYSEVMREAFEGLSRSYNEQGRELPPNTGGARRRDRLIFNYVYENIFKFDTARCFFSEGKPLYPGTVLTEQQHIQICVRNPACVITPINLVRR